MITTVTNDKCYQFNGLSTDKKPLPNDGTYGAFSNGSIFFEMDTSKVFMFDEKNNKWLEI